MRCVIPALALSLTLAGAIPAIAETAITIHAGRLNEPWSR